MLIATLAEKSINQLIQAYRKTDLAEAVEIRWDFLESFDLKQAKLLRNQIQKPIIFTFHNPPNETILFSLADLKPNFFDVDISTPLHIQKKIAAECKIIGSYHNFDCTPNLDQLDFSSPYFTFKKIACRANSSLDTLRLLLYMKEHSDTIAIAMGEIGQPSRILAKVFNAPFIYACIDKPLENTGQLSLQELIDVYRVNQLTPKTRIYGLIGDPVCQSIGHIWHNQRFNSDRIYVRFLVKKHEVHTFLNLALKVPIEGLSVTMPLKNIAPTPINTLYRKDNCYFWKNTDGKAVADLIEEKISLLQKKVFIIGSGGSAMATAMEMQKRGAFVQIYSRSGKKVEKLGFRFAERIDQYDILIHATPIGMHPNDDACILSASEIVSKSLVVDFVSNPNQTKLIRLAKRKNCSCIDGKRIFERQAQYQQKIWEDINKLELCN